MISQLTTELQVRNSFIHDNCYMQGLSYSPTGSSQINSLLKTVVVDHALGVGSLKYKANSTAQSTHACTSGFSYMPAHKYTLAAFTPSQVQELSSIYFSLYGFLVSLITTVANVPRTYKRMRSVTINGQLINGGQYVFTKPTHPFQPSHECMQTFFTNPNLRPAKIEHFVEHSYSDNYHHCFAQVSWPQHHPNYDYFGIPYQVWCATLYEGSLNNFLLPVENIISVLLSAEVVVKEENVLLIVPVIN